MVKPRIYFCYTVILLSPVSLPSSFYVLLHLIFKPSLTFKDRKEKWNSEDMLSHMLKEWENGETITQVERRQKADISYIKECFELKWLRTKILIPSTFEMNVFPCLFFYGISLETFLNGRRWRIFWTAFSIQKPVILGEWEKRNTF